MLDINIVKSKILEVFEEIPVNIDTFVEDTRYLGNTLDRGNAIYPAWRKMLREVFEDPFKYTTVVLTGSIGTGKSTVGSIIAMYMLYYVLNLKDAHRFFRIGASQGNIMFIFNNLTIPKAQQGILGNIVGHCMKSPWFMSRGIITGETNKMYLPNKRVRFGVASEEYHITSTDCYCFCFDEANDVLHNDGNFQDSMAMQILNAANQRIRSRFKSIDRSQFFGKSIVISSKQSEMAFLEQYTNDQLTKDPEHIYVFDKPQWEVIPIVLSGKTFNVAYGNKNAKSYIMSAGEDPEITKQQGFKILKVPSEYRKDFEDNLNRALTEVAGISVAYIDKFFSREYVSKSFDENLSNPFNVDIIISGLRDDKAYADFFNPDIIPKEWQQEKIYMHFDTSKNKDRTGITAVSQSNNAPEELHHLFTIYIEAPKNDQICFKKHEDFVFYLTDVLNWDIQNISSDGFNSAQLKQNFMLHGIDADYISPDRTTVPYLSLQRMLYDGLLKLIYIPLLEKELVELNLDNYKQKIDHPVTGSKDGSDSLACAVQNAINHRNITDVVSEEYSIDDLVNAFKQTANMDADTIFTSITTGSNKIYDKISPDLEENTDMEYFRF